MRFIGEEGKEEVERSGVEWSGVKAERSGAEWEKERERKDGMD
jgi:hypothetical protein